MKSPALTYRAPLSSSGSFGKFVRLAILCLIAVPSFLFAQEKEKDDSKGVASLRCYGELGDRTSQQTYSLTYSTQKQQEETKPLFANYKGTFLSSIGSGVKTMPAGTYRFKLSRDGADESAEAEVKLEKGAIYTLLAFLDNQKPVLRIFKESPILDEQGNPSPTLQNGLVVYNLLPNHPLTIQLGEAAPREVPLTDAKPFFLPASSLSEPITISYQSELKRPRRKVVPYSGQKRLIALFMRNDYGQFTTTVLPAEPTQP